MRQFQDNQVEQAYQSIPTIQRGVLYELRELIFDTAEKTQNVGDIVESLKWHQPSFSTKTGSPIRIDKVKNSEDIAMYFICTTKLVDQFREQYPDTFKFEGNRAIRFQIDDEIPTDELSHCIAMALTYKNR